MSGLIHWKDSGFFHEKVGGKAHALAVLSRAGFEVPPWAVVPPEASLDGSLELPAFLSEPIAVRSSASDEDGADHSFAGQLESFLNVPRYQVTEKIRGVRESGFSERMRVYRSQKGLPWPPPNPAVIVQTMIPAEFAGVAFSSDPVSGRRGLAVVAAVRGLGEALVSGAEAGEAWEVDRNGVITPRGQAGLLTDDLVRKVAALARKAEALFGRPQDIEWAFAQGKLWILQSRPITSLNALHDPDGTWQLWDNSNIAESYSGITTPLTFSFAREIYEEVYRQFVKILRVPTSRIEANRDVFARMLGLIRGRVYYNLLSWYRVLAMLPGFAVNRKFMEQMMGVKEGLPEEALPLVIGNPRTVTLGDYLEIVGTISALIGNLVLLPRKIRAFYQRLDECLSPGPLPLEQLRPEELAAAYRKLQNQLLTRWDAPLINDFFAMIFFGVSRKLVDRWCGDPDGTLQNDLIACQGGIISAEPAKRILHMAQICRQSPGLREVLQQEVILPGDLQAFPAFEREYQAYLEKFGDRCMEELKLESETLHDNPRLLVEAVVRIADNPRSAPQTQEDLAKKAREKADKAMEGKPFRKWMFDWVISQTRDRVRDRENLRFERTRVFGRVRRIFLELGKRLHALGLLGEPRDVFYLETEEVLGFIEGTATTLSLANLVTLRKTDFEEFSKLPPPSSRFETRGMVNHAHTFQMASPAEESTGEERKGIGCCPGVVRGRVRVILHPKNAVIEPGEILVAPRTDPGWILLFPSAAGLLVEHGSLLSHSAIVAREMGIPAVVSVDGLTSWLKTGDHVELDGSTGRVVRIGETSP